MRLLLCAKLLHAILLGGLTQPMPFPSPLFSFCCAMRTPTTNVVSMACASLIGEGGDIHPQRPKVRPLPGLRLAVFALRDSASWRLCERLLSSAVSAPSEHSVLNPFPGPLLSTLNCQPTACSSALAGIPVAAKAQPSLTKDDRTAQQATLALKAASS